VTASRIAERLAKSAEQYGPVAAVRSAVHAREHLGLGCGQLVEQRSRSRDRCVLGVCRNVAHTLRRSGERTEKAAQRLALEPALAVEQPPEPPWGTETVERLTFCLSGLSPREQRVVQLSFTEWRPSSEIAIPPVLSPEALLALQDRGEQMNENVMQPGERRRASFPDGPGLLIHRLQGSELARADRVNLELSTPAGASLVRFENVPFDGATGEVIVACQRHFGESFPANIVFEIERRVVDEVEVVARYTIEHTDWV
jgi:hypothetical protein